MNIGILVVDIEPLGSLEWSVEVKDSEALGSIGTDVDDSDMLDNLRVVDPDVIGILVVDIEALGSIVAVEEEVIVVFEAAVTECEYIETRSSNVCLSVFNIKTSSVEQGPTFDPVITLDSWVISV